MMTSSSRYGQRALPWLLLMAAASMPAWLTGCGEQSHAETRGAGYVNADYALLLKRRPTAAALSEIGRAMFNDRRLSASGQLACASCHSPAHAYGPTNGLAVQLGGTDGKAEGMRAVPSLRYLQTVAPFSEHHFDNDGNDSEDAGPTGGLTWDGRARSRREQAGIPLLAANEMANTSAATVVAKLQQAPYADKLRNAFGDDIFGKPDKAWRAALLSLETFQEQPAEFYPYTSKYDAYLRHQVQLSAREMRGFKLFNEESKGNCASCHISQVTEDGAFPQFSDFGHIALGVPRNMKLAANADPAHFDLGLCGPARTDLKDKKEYCGLFRTPTLRNVALRKRFFHNGSFSKLRDVVKFYATRDTKPELWYPRGKDGKAMKFDDLPAAYRQNVNMEPPFGKKPGEKPALNDREIDDIVAFLKTLTDGYTPGKNL